MFHMSPKPPQMVGNMHPHREGKSVLQIDVIRCRYNQLVQNNYPNPVFCALDSPAPTLHGQLGDYQFLHRTRDLRSPPPRNWQLFGGQPGIIEAKQNGCLTWALSHGTKSFSSSQHQHTSQLAILQSGWSPWMLCGREPRKPLEAMWTASSHATPSLASGTYKSIMPTI